MLMKPESVDLIPKEMIIVRLHVTETPGNLTANTILLKNVVTIFGTLSSRSLSQIELWK